MNEIMDRVMDEIRQFDYRLSTLMGSGNIRSISNEEMILWIVMGCIGLLCCFFGLKCIRVCGMIAGLAVGVEAGYQISVMAGLDSGYIWMASLGAGVVLAVLMTVFRPAAIFITMMSAGYSLSLFVIGDSDDLIFQLIPVAIGLVAALIALRFREVPVLFVTGIYGAVILGNLTYNIVGLTLGFREDLVRFAAYVLWAIVGILIQLLFESGRRKRKNLAQAEVIKNTYSVANDVERARLFVDSMDTGADEESEDSKNQQLQKDSDLQFVSLEDDDYDGDLDDDESEEYEEEYEDDPDGYSEEYEEEYEDDPDGYSEEYDDESEEYGEEYEDDPDGYSEEYDDESEEYDDESEEYDDESEEYDEEYEDDLDGYNEEYDNVPER